MEFFFSGVRAYVPMRQNFFRSIKKKDIALNLNVDWIVRFIGNNLNLNIQYTNEFEWNNKAP